MHNLYYQPEGYWVGDIMPLGNKGKFYLYDQRDNRNPAPLPFGEPFSWCLTTTENFIDYNDYGVALPKGGESDVDQFVFAGSVFANDGKLHAFYTGYNRNFEKEGKTSQVLLHASSNDYINWEKSFKMLTLEPQKGYDIGDWRDPWVIWNDEEKEYLLILGARLEGPKTQMTGRVVYFTSKNLEDWEFKGDFWSSNKYTMIEMPDLFKINNWWYLIYTEYSEQSKTRYVMSESLEGPWITPEDDAFDGRAYYAARSAFDGERRVLFGWVATKENDDDLGTFQWGGAFVPHEVYQKSDNTLGVKPVKSLWNYFSNTTCLSNKLIEARNKKESEILVDKTGDLYSFETDIEIENDTKEFSIQLFKNNESEESYDFKFSIVNNYLEFDKVPNFPWYQMMNKGLTRPIKLRSKNIYNLKIIVDGTIFTIYIDGVALNVRGYKKIGESLAVSVTDGSVNFINSKYSVK